MGGGGGILPGEALPKTVWKNESFNANHYHQSSSQQKTLPSRVIFKEAF